MVNPGGYSHWGFITSAILRSSKENSSSAIYSRAVLFDDSDLSPCTSNVTYMRAILDYKLDFYEQIDRTNCSGSEH